jgi:hypothetical protein
MSNPGYKFLRRLVVVVAVLDSSFINGAEGYISLDSVTSVPAIGADTIRYPLFVALEPEPTPFLLANQDLFLRHLK